MQSFDKKLEAKDRDNLIKLINAKDIGDFYKQYLIQTAKKLAALLPLQNLEKNNEYLTFKSYLDEEINIATWATVKPKIDQVVVTAHDQKYKYKEDKPDIESTVARFDREVEFKLKQPELKQIEDLFKKATSYKKNFILASDDELNAAIRNSIAVLKEHPDKINYRSVVIAAFREKIHRLYGIFPNKMQIINMFALINNPRRVAQIKTGEGKSLIIAMLSAYFALLGRKIDIITTSPDLALPQSKQYTPFYRSLGLTVDCNAGDDRNCDPNVYKADIIYGTPQDFEAAKLHDGLGGAILERTTDDQKPETTIETDGHLARGDRPYDIAIIDEVDSMFLDTGNECLWLPLTEESPEIIPLYEAIWKYVSSNDKPDLTELSLFINSQKIGLEFKEDDPRLDFMLHPLMMAACQAKKSKEKINYMVIGESDEKSIEIVNLPTGQIQFGTRWSQGVHAFVELKHGIKPQCTVEIHAASISPPDLFANYASVIGLSGTLGSPSDLKELSKVHNVDMYASPTFSEKSNVFELDPLIVADEQKQFETILGNILKENGKPTLVVMDSIRSVERFKLFLTEKLAEKKQYNVNIYDRQKSLSELENISANAGKPFSITLTTNIGGRGWDIPLTEEAEKLGGLYEITTYPPENQRIEDQASGRAGRKGQPGIIQTIAHLGQFKAFRAIQLEEKEGYREFRVKRETYNQFRSQQRQKDRALLALQYSAEEFYFSLPLPIKNKLLKNWAIDCYNPIVTYIDNIKSFLKKNPLFYGVLDKIHFEEMVAKLLVEKIQYFWQKNLPFISKHMAKGATPNLEDWVSHTKNKFTTRLFTLSNQMKAITEKPEVTVTPVVAEEKKQIEVVIDLDLTLLPEFTGGTFDKFACDTGKPQDSIVHYDKLKQYVSSAGTNVNFTVASFGINVARSDRVMKELNVENGQALGFHPELMDEVLDEKKVEQRCQQNQAEWGQNCVNNLTKILETVGFGKPPNLTLLHMCQLTILTSCGKTGKNIHLLLSILLRLQSDKKITDLVFVDDDPTNIDAAKQFHLALPQLAKLLGKPELEHIKIHPVLADVKEESKSKFSVNWFDKFDATMKQIQELPIKTSPSKDASVSALIARDSWGAGFSKKGVKASGAAKSPTQDTKKIIDS